MQNASSRSMSLSVVYTASAYSLSLMLTLNSETLFRSILLP